MVKKPDNPAAEDTRKTAEKTAERTKAAEEKKTADKKASKTTQPKIVTKDTNVIAEDNSDIFSEPFPITQADVDLEFDYPKSKTIDRSLLSQDRMRGKGRRGKNTRSQTLDLSQAERYDTGSDFGLSSEQVAKRNEEGYVNIVKKKVGKSYASIFATNICTFFNLLMIIVAVALIVVKAQISNLFFMVIIIANISIGIIQEIKSKKAVDKLSLLTAPAATVVRDGERCVIPVNEVVLDDIIYLEMGKQICTDSIVIKGECEVNESMLTGESVAVKKGVGAEVFAGSFVSSGNCYARADKVGASNYVETLTSHAKKYKKPKSELHNSVRLIIKAVSVIIIPITVMLILVGYKDNPGNWQSIISNASGAVIGMIPAGMFLLTSMALAVSVIRLAKKKTLVQDLYCIEMLARVNVLCLDKTGTITDGTMQVNNVIEIKGSESAVQISEAIGSMLSATQDNNQTALALADKFGYNSHLKPKTVLPFSSQRKLSAVTFEGAGTYMLGAPEFVLRDMGVRIEKIINDNAANGYRVLVLAHSPAEILGDKLPAVRRPLCLIVIEDHIREDAITTIKWFKDNSVAVKVISGDNPITVSEVAKRVGVENADLYISLDGLNNQEVVEAANKYTVFGRVTPEQKSILVKSLKAKGNTVAMTGDGVNDILAMREADCSVAIASGAEAARNVSHLVLLDNNFTSMPDVVMEGRRVVNNIQKSSSLFLMKTFMSIVLSVLFLALGEKYPFQPANLIPLETCIIGIPSFFLALQPNKNIIKGKFLSNVISRAVPGGISLVLTVVMVYLYNRFFVTGISNEQYISMLVLGITFTGYMTLAKICEPLDAFRTVLIILVIPMIFAVIFVMKTGVAQLELLNFLYLTNLVFISYFVVTILMKVLSHIKY